MEDDLLSAVRQRQAELDNEPAATRHIAEQRLLSAFQAYTAFAVEGKLPDTHARFHVIDDEDED